MIKITIEINTENDAFQENMDAELRAVTQQAMMKFENGISNAKLKDGYGNTCGTITVVRDGDDE